MEGTRSDCGRSQRQDIFHASRRLALIGALDAVRAKATGSDRVFAEIVRDARKRLAAKLQKLRPYTDDVWQEACLYLWCCVCGGMEYDAKSAAKQCIVLLWLRAFARWCNLIRDSTCARESESAFAQTALDEPITPMKAMERAEAESLLADAIDALSAEDQELLRSRYFDRATFSAIQKQTGLSQRTAKWRQRRILKQLRVALSA